MKQNMIARNPNAAVFTRKPVASVEQSIMLTRGIFENEFKPLLSSKQLDY